MITELERFIRILKSDGTLSDRAADFLEDVVRQVNLATPIRGNGSPEGAITANPDQRYLDTTGNVEYIKKSGTGNTGWISL